MKKLVKNLFKWLVIPLGLAIAAEVLLLWIASTFGKSTGEMSLNRPSAIWLTWHSPGLLLAMTVFGHDALAVVVFAFTAGTLQFFVIFVLMIALVTGIRAAFRWISSKSKLRNGEDLPPTLPSAAAR